MNTLDPDFFEMNIAEGYRQRKERHTEKDNAEISMDLGLYQLLMSSNQIIHNRGRALAYLCGSKKRFQHDSEGDQPMESKPRKAPHQYQPKTRVVGKMPEQQTAQRPVPQGLLVLEQSFREQQQLQQQLDSREQ